MTDAAAEDAPPLVDLDTLRQVVAIQSFTRWTGLEIVRVERGLVETSMRLRKDDMTQHHGFLHGGLVGFLADNVSAYAGATVLGDVVTAQYQLNLLAPGVGERFRAVGRMVKAGKRQAVTQAEVFAVKADGAEKLIALATATILPVGAKAA